MRDDVEKEWKMDDSKVIDDYKEVEDHKGRHIRVLSEEHDTASSFTGDFRFCPLEWDSNEVTDQKI